MAAIELTKENFEELVSSSDISIIDFWASWCGPCQAFAPTFESVSEEHADLLFGKVNTEQHQELAAHFNIRSIPTLMVIRKNIVVFSQPGALPKSALEEVIQQTKALDMQQVREEIAKQQAA